MQRSALYFLVDWFKRVGKKPLIIRGARQVGKSYLVRDFAQRNSLSLLEINFEKDPKAKSLFDPSSIHKTCEFLELRYHTRIDPKATLLFLDEIQAAPEVIPTLRYFYEERPDLAVVAAGSLLEFVLADHSFSMPVGRVEYLHLGSMTFEEFLLAKGEMGWHKFIQEFELRDSIPAPLHQQLIDLVRVYCLTGGMPEVIKTYLAASRWDDCEAVKANLLSTYEDDFSKYRKRIPDARLRKTFRTIPRLIAEKLKYVAVDPSERAKDLAQALDALCMARVAHRVCHSSANGVPLASEANPKFFKMLFLDVGLVSSILGLNRLDLEKTGDLNFVNQGKLSEQFVGQQLLGDLPFYCAPELHYWAREKKNASAEVDYVTALGSQVVPIEVKSGKTGSLRSLWLFLKEKNLPLGLRFNSEPPSVHKDQTHTLISLPFYLVGQWRRLLGTGSPSPTP